MAIIFNNKKKKAKVERDHSYAGFWLDRGAANVELDGRSQASSVVKAIKLRNYQKAIGNFVKILSQKDVPVYFKGTESYTDFDHVTIAGNVNDKNFDVTAGLALHEASHLKHTQKEVLTTFVNGSVYGHQEKMEIKEMLNWIEDRRIDTIVFKNCPGYKGYYHKMYDHYFRNKDIAKMLKSPKYCTPTMENFFAHIINMMNPAYDSRRIIGLTEITKLINVNNISRLKDTEAALELAKEVVVRINEIIGEEELNQTQQQQQSGAGENDEDQEDQDTQSGPGPDSSDEEEEEEETEDEGSEGDEEAPGAEGSENDEEGNEGPEMQDLTPQEEAKVQKALEEAKHQVNQQTKKKQIANSVAKKIVQLQDSEVDFAPVGDGRQKTDCLIYRLDKEVHKLAAVTSANEYLAELRAKDEFESSYSNRKTKEQSDAQQVLSSYDGPAGLTRLSYGSRQGAKLNETQVNEGLQLGAMLGRKLLTRRESRSLETTRLRSGRIDNKRLAHAGYGIENIFSQIHIEKYKKANIHLTIDASGSMGGDRWKNSIKMAAAIGKAVSMIDGLELQVSMRETDHNDTPVVSIIYDSRANRLGHLTNLLNVYECNSMTPEGLCLEAMLKKNLLIPSNEECDSYLINICDGAPGCGNYGGHNARYHTKKQVKRINNELGIKHVGFFFGDPDRSGFFQFKEMYGVKQSKALPNASNAAAIATHLNKELMNK